MWAEKRNKADGTITREKRFAIVTIFIKIPRAISPSRTTIRGIGVAEKESVMKGMMSRDPNFH